MNAIAAWQHKCTYGILDYSERVVAGLQRKLVPTIAKNRMVACQEGNVVFLAHRKPAFMRPAQLGATNKGYLR